MRISKVSIIVASWTIIGVLYFPIFVCAWVLRIFARVLLAIAYFGMLDGKMGKAVLSSLFTWNNRV